MQTDDARARADDARRAIESGAAVGDRRRAADRARRRCSYEPVDEEELGVTRRQFFNRSILAGVRARARRVRRRRHSRSCGRRPRAAPARKVTVGSEADAKAAFDNKIPFYNAGAKIYIVAYPKARPPEGEEGPCVRRRSSPGMEQGYVALYQKCVHLGCRVPWCQSSQWFECPCHGSKYNRVGEKQGGPAPRGLDRFPLEVSGGNIVVDTGNLIIGPPIGTEHHRPEPGGSALCLTPRAA